MIAKVLDITIRLLDIIGGIMIFVIIALLGSWIGTSISESAKKTPHWWRVLYPKKYRRYP